MKLIQEFDLGLDPHVPLILALLQTRQGQITVEKLSQTLKLPQPRMRHYLKLFEAYGLIRIDKSAGARVRVLKSLEEIFTEDHPLRTLREYLMHMQGSHLHLQPELKTRVSHRRTLALDAITVDEIELLIKKSIQSIDEKSVRARKSRMVQINFEMFDWE
jgi:hypothetical protein